MLRVCEKLGFQQDYSVDTKVVRAELEIGK